MCHFQEIFFNIKKLNITYFKHKKYYKHFKHKYYNSNKKRVEAVLLSHKLELNSKSTTHDEVVKKL